MSTSPLRNVIVVGGGGNLGPVVIKALDEDSNFHVSVLSRNSSKSTFPLGIKVHKIADHYPENELVEAFFGQDVVVSTIGVPHALQQIPMIDAAVKAGVRRFLPAEFGGNKENSKVASLPLFADKRKIIAYLKSKESDKFSWTGIATGPFFDWGLKNGLLGFDIQSRKARIYDSGDISWSATLLSTIGLAVARTLLHPEETENKFIFIYSISTTQNEVLSVLEKVTRGKLQVENQKMEDIVRDGEDKLRRGDRSGAVALILSTMFQEGRGSDFTKCTDTANGLLGLPEESLEALVRSSLS